MRVRGILAGIVLLAGTALPATPQTPAEKEALRAQARQLLIEARSLAQNAKDPQRGAVALMNIAGTFVLIGDFSRAHETARMLGSQKEIDMALDSIARSQVQQRDLNAALQTLNLIGNEYEADMLLHTLVFACVDMGDVAAAVTHVNRIRRPSRRAIAMAQVATAKKTGGRQFPTIEMALSLVDSVADPGEQISALTAIAGFQHRAGDAQGARQTLARARPLLAAPSANRTQGRSLANLLNLASAHASAGDAPAAFEFLDLLQRSMGQGMDSYVDRALMRVAERLAFAGETAVARALAERTSNPEAGELVLCHVAFGRISKDDVDTAKEILASLSFAYPRLILLQAVAVEDLHRGHIQPSGQAFRRALELLIELPNEQCQQAAGGELAVHLARSSEAALAADVVRRVGYGKDPTGWLWGYQAMYGNWEEVLAESRKLSEPGDQAMALAIVADGLALRAQGHTLSAQRTAPRFSSLSACMPREPAGRAPDR